MHTNEAIWLVLKRAWLEYRSRLTSHNIKNDFFDNLTVYYCHLLTLVFTKNMEENITELIPDWCDENFDVLARNADEYEN